MSLHARQHPVSCATTITVHSALGNSDKRASQPTLRGCRSATLALGHDRLASPRARVGSLTPIPNRTVVAAGLSHPETVRIITAALQSLLEDMRAAGATEVGDFWVFKVVPLPGSAFSARPLAFSVLY